MIKAFTLTELLVVVFLVGLLIGLLYPCLSSTKVNASKADRLERLRQIHVASALYDSDFVTYPPVGEPGLLVVAGYLPSSQIDERFDQSPHGYGNTYRQRNGKFEFPFHVSASGYLDGYEPEVVANLPSTAGAFRFVICPTVIDRGLGNWTPTGRYEGLGFDGGARTAIVKDQGGTFRFVSLFMP